MHQKLHTFLVNEQKGKVSALLQKSDRIPVAQVVLAHGAGANMQHAHMQSIADMFSAIDVDTLRYQFPYMETGGGRVDNLDICMDTISAAIALSVKLNPKLPIFLAGHSFGGRMSSHFAASISSNRTTSENRTNAKLIRGLIYFSFPLHPSKKPDIKRAEHLGSITLPQLFLSGTRDLLADLDLLEPIIKKLNHATLHTISTADHGYKILKRTRESKESVFDEAGRVVQAFINKTF